MSTSPAPAPSSTPAVDLPLSPPRTVVFDYLRLEAIEVAMDKSILEVLQSMLPRPPAGYPGGEISEQTMAELGAKIRVSVVAKFVAACLGVELGDLAGVVPMASLMPVFFRLVEGLGRAIGQLDPGDEADPQKPGSGGSAPSAPGPASN